MFQIFVNVRVLQSFLNSPWSRKLIAPAKKNLTIMPENNQFYELFFIFFLFLVISVIPTLSF